MKNANKLHVSESKLHYIELMKLKFEAVMPEVHRQVKIYEEKLKSGKLTSAPKSNPLFSE